MTRTAMILLLIGASALAGCDVTFYGTDETRPVIESVSANPSAPVVGEMVTISARVYEPDSWYEVTYDTDGDGRFDDSATVTYRTAGWKSIRVRARSAGGEDIVTYPVEVAQGTVSGVWLNFYNDTGHGVGLNIYESDGDQVAWDVYVAPNEEYGFYAYPGETYKVQADNQYAYYGPDWIYVGSAGTTVTVSSLDY